MTVADQLARDSSFLASSATAVIVVALGFDESYAPHAAVVIVSLIQNTPGALFRFILLHTGTSASARRQIESLSSKSSFDWIEVRDDDVPPFADKEWITRATLFRLGLEKLAPKDCTRVIYLDADLVIKSDLRELWNTDLHDRGLAAVTDVNVDAYAFGKRWRLTPGHGYFNAGVLLIDLAKIRADRSFSKTLDFLAEHNQALPYSDQDALNWTFWGDWLPLDPRWNVQRLSVIEANSRGWAASGKLLRNTAILHYTGSAKPWLSQTYHPWAGLYWAHLRRTTFISQMRKTSRISSVEFTRIWLRWLRSRLMQLI